MDDFITTTIEALTEAGAYCTIRSTIYHAKEPYVWGADERPDPADHYAGGECAPMDAFCNGNYGGHPCSCAEDFKAVQYVEVHGATWGDYMMTGLYERWNHQELLEDFEPYLIDVYGDMFSHMLLLPVGIEVEPELIDALAGLLDYPVYNESGYSDFCVEIQQEDWESFGRADYRIAMERHARAKGDDEFADDSEAVFSDEDLDRIVAQDETVQWYAESSQGGYFEGLELSAQMTYDGHARSIELGWEKYAREITAEQYAGMAPLFEKED